MWFMDVRWRASVDCVLESQCGLCVCHVDTLVSPSRQQQPSPSRTSGNPWRDCGAEPRRFALRHLRTATSTTIRSTRMTAVEALDTTVWRATAKVVGGAARRTAPTAVAAETRRVPRANAWDAASNTAVVATVRR